MKTAIVLSDTHGNKNIIKKLYPLFAENDYIIHLGDGNLDMLDVYRNFPDKTFVCRGNCDVQTHFSRNEWEIEIEQCKLFCTHGHSYGVKSGLDSLKKEAYARRCNVVLYGHTHSAFEERTAKMSVMNPGNLTVYSAHPSYGYLIIDKNRVMTTVVPILS